MDSLRTALASIGIILLLAACGAPTPAPTAAAVVPTFTPTNAPPATATPEPTPTSTTRTLTVAINAAFKPFIFVDENGKLAGFDIDLLNALDAATETEVAYVNITFEKMLDGVASGAYDAAIGALTITPARQERMDFTEPYFRTGQSPVSFFSAGQGLAVPNGATTITSTASLTANNRLGVERGTTGAEFAASATAAQVVAFPAAEQVLAALSAGEVDAVVLDIAFLADYTISNPGAIMLIGGPVTEEEYAIAVNKQRPEVLTMLNEALAEIRANGDYDRIFQKWFGTP
jgi:ABC-type amino acid transport substrate-binding protein